MDDNNDVVVRFFAPWSAHCRRLQPHWRDVAKAFEDERGVVIAELNAHDNDFSFNDDPKRFPTILLFPAHDKKNPIPYDGQHDASDIKLWITNVRRALHGKKDEL